MKAIVVGAGFGGLAAALRLRKAGLEVTVLEQFAEPGGKAVGWGGVPTGPTVLTMPEIPQRIFAAFGQNLPTLEPVSPLTRYVYPDGREFAPELDMERTVAQLTSEEGRDYRRLLEVARTMYQGARDTFIFGPPPGLYKLGKYGLGEGLKAQPLKTLEQLVESGPYLTPFFLRFATYLGANPYRAPAVLHNIAWVELGLGVYHLEGGMKALATALYELARQQGIEFVFGQKVLKMQLEPQGVRAVQTDGGWHAADFYVSAADRHFTHGWLGLPVPKEKLGVAGFAVLIKLRHKAGLGHHIFFPSDYRKEWREIEAGSLPTEPTLYLHTDADKAFLLVNAPSGSGLGARGSSAEDYALTLLNRLHRSMPLDVAEFKIMTPQDYSSTAYRGALYGRAPHGLLGALRPGWQIRGIANLVQVGGTVHPGGGVPLSMLSGWNGAQWGLRRYGISDREES